MLDPCIMGAQWLCSVVGGILLTWFGSICPIKRYIEVVLVAQGGRRLYWDTLSLSGPLFTPTGHFISNTYHFTGLEVTDCNLSVAAQFISPTWSVKIWGVYEQVVNSERLSNTNLQLLPFEMSWNKKKLVTMSWRSFWSSAFGSSGLARSAMSWSSLSRLKGNQPAWCLWSC